MFPGLGGDFEQQRTGAAGGVVGGGGSHGIPRRDADDLGHDPADLGRGVELPLALAALGGEVAHEILVGIAQDVVVLRAVLGEIQFRLLEDTDEVGKAVHHRLALAEFVRVVEVREVAAGQAGVAVNERLDDLGVDLVADVALALQRDHILEARPLGDGDGRGEVIGIAVFVGDVFDEQHEQDIVLVLAGIHAAAKFIAGGPERGVEVGFFYCHERPLNQLLFKEFLLLAFYLLYGRWKQIIF